MRKISTDKSKKGEPRINYQIRAKEVRVIGPQGDQLGVLPIDIAKKKAMDLGLDLVEVSPNARPPVCKILDFGKYKYNIKKQAVKQKKKQHVIELKEIKFRPRTDQHDIDIKVNKSRKFLESGNKLKATIMFRGREITHPEIGKAVLEKVAKTLEEVSTIEVHPKMEGRSMSMILAPLSKK